MSHEFRSRHGGMNNLQLRTVSAIVLGGVVLRVTWQGGLPFTLLASAIGALVLYEWLAMTRPVVSAPARAVAVLVLAAVLVALLAGAPAAWIWTGLAAGTLACAVLDKAHGSGWWASSGLAYAGASAVALAFLRGTGSEGLAAILLIFAVVWTTDIMAYFVGRAVGGPKLAPSISPGKTWSGAIGGAVCGIVAALIFSRIVPGLPSPVLLVVAALVLSVVSQAGDLFESWVKRRRGVKDSSNLIPGHGGVMDRVDGLVVAAIALYLLGWLAGSADAPAKVLFAG